MESGPSSLVAPPTLFARPILFSTNPAPLAPPQKLPLQTRFNGYKVTPEHLAPLTIGFHPATHPSPLCAATSSSGKCPVSDTRLLHKWSRCEQHSFADLFRHGSDRGRFRKYIVREKVVHEPGGVGISVT